MATLTKKERNNITRKCVATFIYALVPYEFYYIANFIGIETDVWLGAVVAWSIIVIHTLRFSDTCNKK